jgi:hypothetical protein
MTCAAPVGVVWAGLTLIGYLVRETIWHLMIAAGWALAGTMLALAGTLLVGASAAFVQWRRRRQTAAGACNTCDHPCKAHAPQVPQARPAKPWQPQPAPQAPQRLVALPLPTQRAQRPVRKP